MSSFVSIVDDWNSSQIFHPIGKGLPGTSIPAYMKTKYLTEQEREDKAIIDLQLFIEKIERRYKISIKWNIEDITLAH